jgi:hypothetical protein
MKTQPTQTPQSNSSSAQSSFTRIDFYDLIRKAANSPVQKPEPKAK